MSNIRLYITLTLILCSVLGAQAENRRIFRTITASNGLADNSAQTIKCTKTGRMTITTIGNINFYDGANFSYINTELEDKYQLENYNGEYHLFYDNAHHLWLKAKHNVTCVNLTTEVFVANMDSLFAAMGMEEKIYDLFVDVDGNVWFCGKNHIQDSNQRKHFPIKPQRNLQDLEVYQGKDLFLLYDDGLLECFDVASGKKKYQNSAYVRENATKYSKSSVVQLVNDGFFQIRNGEHGAILLRYDAGRRAWTTVMESEYHLNNMAIHEDVLYIASEWGYFTYDLRTDNLVHVKSLTLSNGRQLDTDINAVEFDRQGGMWIGTEKRGLLYARPLNAPFRTMHYEDPETAKYYALLEDLKGISEFNGKKANVLFIDSRRWTWVGTSSGLYLYKSPQDEPLLLTRNVGLLNNVIHSIIEDNMHNVWVSTSYGITCMQIANDSIKHFMSFNEEDNIPNETFIDGKALKMEDGTIVMQSLDHIVMFNPADFHSLLSQQPMQMLPKLTSLLVDGTFVKTGMEINGFVILSKAITRTKEINLNYDMNSISLTFSALNFARPLQTYYRVRIKELGDGWQTYSYYNSGGLVDGRGLLHLPLVGLHPGTYHIELQASNVSGKWVGEPYVWIVNVHQPWWRATGLLVFLTIVLLTLLGINFYLYNRNTRLRVKRNSDEGDMVRRIQNFVERCEVYNQETIKVEQPDEEGVQETEISEEFINLMIVVLPYIKQKDGKFTIRELIDLTGSDVNTFYQTLSTNLYKSPRSMARVMRLLEVQDQLRNTSKTVEDIALDCHFESPNCLISSFYHRFKMTPRDYRLSI